MKLDDKKKKVQMKYREKIRENKEDGNLSEKLLFVVTTNYYSSGILGKFLLKTYVIQFKIL
ncbi:hypothetical protein ACIGC1_29205 [Peribacillus butanolivorans]|uniref:hypothetical protein n=1 Tax=Peribacillus butanolivorans TaxID=421767 RepID=UPI0037C629D0